MPDWQSYRLEDFVPFTAEVYLRLIERVNEAFWPLHGATLALGVAILLLSLRGHGRLALALLAPAWLTSAFVFHFDHYAELNWAASWFGRAFVVQALLVLAVAARPAPPREERKSGWPGSIVGTALVALGTVGYPAIAPIAGSGWTQAEFFGLHSDPTAIATLGIVMLVQRGIAQACLLVIPVAACLVATATLVPLELAWALLPLSAVAACILALALDAVVRRRAASGRPA